MAPPRKPKPKKNCLICNKEFELKSCGKSHAGRKYCSPECRNVSQRKYVDRSWTLICSICNKVHKYSTRENYRRAIREGRKMCIPCKGKMNKGLTRTPVQKELISEKTKEAMHTPFIRKKVLEGNNRPEVKRKRREARIKQMEESGGWTSFNKTACYFFDELNKYFSLNGQHALNGGEYQVAGYFVDYYEPSLNIVIEWDEPHHKKQVEKDLIRAEEIIKELGCTFFRIDEETLEITEVIL
jgi:hypothetical protein